MPDSNVCILCTVEQDGYASKEAIAIPYSVRVDYTLVRVLWSVEVDWEAVESMTHKGV